MTTTPPAPAGRPSISRSPRSVSFGDVRGGEGGTVLLLFANLFLLLVGYYVLKTVRDTLILTDASGGAEVKAYASAGQALLLIGFVPLYSRLAARVDRVKLIFGMLAFYVVSIELFAPAIQVGVPYAAIGLLHLGRDLQPHQHRAVLVLRERPLPPRDRRAPLPDHRHRGHRRARRSAPRSWPGCSRRASAPRPCCTSRALLLVVHLALYWVVNRRESRGRHDQAAVEP